MSVWKGLSRASAYAVSVVATVAAILIRWLVSPWLSDEMPHATVYAAVAVAVWLGGYRPALLAMGLGFLACDLLFIGPFGQLDFAAPHNLMHSGSYLLFGSTIIFFGERMRRAVERAERMAEDRRVLDERLRMALTASGTMAWSRDLRTGEVSASDNVEAILGLSVEKITSDGLRAVLPEDAASLRAAIEDAVAENGEYRVDVPVARSDGQTAWLRHRAKVEYDVSGEALRMSGTATDITDLKRAQEALQKREQQLHLVADAMPVLISYVDRDRRYRFVNRLYGAWFKRSIDSVLGRTMDEILGPINMERAAPYVERALGGQEAHFELEADYPAGARWVEGAYLPDFDASGDVAGFCVLVHDVTKRKQDEAALRDSEARLRAILDHLPVGVGLVDTEGRTVLCNSTMESYVPERIPSRDPARQSRWRGVDDEGQTLSPRDWPVERALRGETVRPGLEFVYRTDDERELWLRVSAVPFRGADGQVSGAIVVVQDITDHKEIHTALQAVDRRKDEFVATLAHELRNPLAAIRNAVDILKAKGSPDPDARWVSEVVDRQIQHISRLLEDLLDVSRIAHDKLTLRTQLVELSEVIRTAIETCRPHLDGAGHELSVSLPERPVYLQADPVRLAQVFSNLLANSAKYTRAGGHIRVEAEWQGDEVVVCVKDDGIGISPEMLPRLFEIFSQGEGAFERSQGGLGVGLSLVRGLLELHGGRVEAKSEGVGKGSEFVVRLPMHVERLPPHAVSRPQEWKRAPASSSCRLLIVDDMRDSTDTLAMVMRIMGHEVHTAYDGEEAIVRAAQLQPQVVILDIGMPKRDGFDTCRYIREQPWGKDMTLIALTGWGREVDRRRTDAAGFDYHLVKPVNPGALLELLSSLTASARESERVPLTGT